MSTNIYIYPQVSSQAELNSVISRLAWYITPYLDKVATIQLSVADKKWLKSVTLAPHLDPLIEARIPDIISRLTYRSADGLAHEIKKGDPASDIFLLIDERAEATMKPALKKQFAQFTAKAGRYRVDPERTRQEGSFYLWAGLNKLSNAAELTKTYEERFAQMAAEIGDYEKAYVFGTGPSFSDFIDGHDFSDGLSIVANSIVKNDHALDILKPKIICAGDPIYHAGCSSYAAAFRTSLVEALKKTGAWFICPLRDAGVYRAFLPPELEARMVCIPFDKAKPVQNDIRQDFYINPYPNILTLALLPLAATFAQSIHIVGCDGRTLLNDSFFWSHDKKVQFNDQMSEIQAAHPGFFSIDYNDYYLDHCLDLEHSIRALEEAGRTVVNETPSLIPALAHRQASEPQKAPDLSVFAMIDPDAKDDWGHFLAYDKRIAAAAQANDLSVALLCREDLKAKYRPESVSSMHNVFSVHSWTVGNKTPAKREDVLKFARQLDQGLQEIESTYPDGDIALFFYVGSLEVAEMLEFLLNEHPRVHAVIDLFWSYNFDQTAPEYAKRWEAVTRRMTAHPRLHLMHATKQIADEFAKDWGVSLPVLEHPSTTFNDTEANKLASTQVSLAATSTQPLRVVFPGGARAEKGFVLSCEAVNLLRNDADFSLALRSRLDNVSGKALHDAFAALDKTGIEVIDQDLSDAEFIDMIRDADIIVIPYHASAFRRRTSGILVDAMLLGKPVVVLEDTWLASIVDVEKTGISVEATPQGLADGIRAIAKDRSLYSDAIEKARRAYLKTNTWDALVRHVCQITGDPRFSEGASAPALDMSQILKIEMLLTAASQLLLGRNETHPRLTADQIQDISDALGAEHPALLHYRRVEAHFDGARATTF